MATAAGEARSFTTRDGVELFLRPIQPADKTALVKSFAKLSDETRYARFLGLVDHLTERELTRFTDVDHRSHQALVALTAGGEIVGVARYIAAASQPGTAEVAVTVADEWQARGVGTVLLKRLIADAECNGIEVFTAYCFASNSDMLVLFRELGESVRQTSAESGVVELEIRLPTDAPDLVAPTIRAVAARDSVTHAPPA